MATPEVTVSAEEPLELNESVDVPSPLLAMLAVTPRAAEFVLI